MTATSRPDVWVTFEPPDGCLCWRDALCPHDWTWDPDLTCLHSEYFEPVHESLADAVRDLFCIWGAESIGCLIRERYRSARKVTRTVYVMPPGTPLEDDHHATGGPHPLAVISRYEIFGRTTPRHDIDGRRAFANGYRP